jgi:TfoX/Sxy family transcriptional regulator of competence genes
VAYDDRLAERVRKAVGPRADVTERKMFGGIAWLRGGKMFAGVATADLMIRTGPEAHAAALRRAHARPMDFTGRPMVGYVFVAPRGTATVRQIATWIDAAYDHVGALPMKSRRKARPRPRPHPRATRRARPK